jgi:pimeloyl-ACP methyl ester carboxylesterase
LDNNGAKDDRGGCVVTDRGNSTENNCWFSFDEDSSTAIVMVHGYFSSAAKCWTSPDGAHWPTLIAADPRTNGIPIFLGGYHTSSRSGTYGVHECAEELYRALKRTSVSGAPGPLSKPNIIFVCHSMGGIVVRHLLERYRETFREQNVGLCMFASPSLGSGYADLAGVVTWVLRNRAGAQLRFMSQYLSDLDDRFAQYLDNEAGKFLGAEATEHLPPKFGWIRLPKAIVSKASSARYFSRRQVLHGTDHSSIVKPETVNCPGHNFLVDFLQEFRTKFPSSHRATIKPVVEVVLAEPNVVQAPLAALFSAYEERYEDYYLTRAIDEELIQKLDCACVWIYGPSGVGKTCAIKRNVSEMGYQSLHVCLSQCGDYPTRDELIREIFETYSVKKGLEAGSSSYQSLIRFLLDGDGADLLVYVDEVSSTASGEGAAEELLRLCVDISITASQRQGRRIKFVISSLFKPQLEANRAGKINEIFLFLEMGRWDRLEMLALVEMIVSSISTLELDQGAVDTLLSEAAGSPRFLKTFYKLMHWSTDDGRDFSRILRDTRASIAA